MLKNLETQEYRRNGIDYEKYALSGREWITCLVEAILLLAVIGYFFYRSVWACLILSPLIIIFFKEKRKELNKSRKQELNVQFKDMVLSVSANQRAGYSVENSFREAYRDMAMLYGSESYICHEIDHIVKGLDNNITLERLLYDLGARSHVPDIMQFADVFMIAKRSGGNMTEILAQTADAIEQKIAVDKEIQVMVSAKKMEQKIMNVVPFLIIIYIEMTSKGFFDALYHNLTGIIVMTVCLALYLAAFMISKKLVEIEV
ncbi:MAG: type II secretion system F family protein [Butyrivibrio sp.]|nr:type II secretion system F family protein [Butyrivibrio sp.]